MNALQRARRSNSGEASTEVDATQAVKAYSDMILLLQYLGRSTYFDAWRKKLPPQYLLSLRLLPQATNGPKGGVRTHNIQKLHCPSSNVRRAINTTPPLGHDETERWAKNIRLNSVRSPDFLSTCYMCRYFTACDATQCTVSTLPR